MTNLVGTIVITLATNWVTESRTIPAYENPHNYAIYFSPMLNQRRDITREVWFETEWSGEKKRLLIESKQVDSATRRTISEVQFNLCNGK